MILRYMMTIALMVCSMGSYAIEVRDVFHHKAGMGDQKGSSIELGSIVLYLDQFPKIVDNSTKHGDLIKRTIFLPNVTTLSPKAHEIIKTVNQTKDLPYKIAIELKKLPNPGMEIAIFYNSKLIGVTEPRSFDAISMHAAVAIQFYDRKIVRRMSKESRPIIELAQNKETPLVVIDCGHGGQDIGAIGVNNLKKKEVSLSIGLQVASLLRDAHMQVIMTRDNDTTLHLDERTVCANKHNAYIFLSIHANSAPNKAVSGVETYCIANNLFKTTGLITSDKDEIIFRKCLASKYDESKKLAEAVHSNVLSSLSVHQVHDRNVRHSVGQVLFGAAMPAILVEVGYLSHEKEAAQLAQHSYQADIARGIVQGIQAFRARLAL